jgi:hypothetical protein
LSLGGRRGFGSDARHDFIQKRRYRVNARVRQYHGKRAASGSWPAPGLAADLSETFHSQEPGAPLLAAMALTVPWPSPLICQLIRMKPTATKSLQQRRQHANSANPHLPPTEIASKPNPKRSKQAPQRSHDRCLLCACGGCELPSICGQRLARNTWSRLAFRIGSLLGRAARARQFRRHDGGCLSAALPTNSSADWRARGYPHTRRSPVISNELPIGRSIPGP